MKQKKGNKESKDTQQKKMEDRASKVRRLNAPSLSPLPTPPSYTCPPSLLHLPTLSPIPSLPLYYPFPPPPSYLFPPSLLTPPLPLSNPFPPSLLSLPSLSPTPSLLPS